MESRFADLHCHPHMRSFNWLHKKGEPEINKQHNPWWIILPNFKAEERGNRAAAYSQSDMAKVANGNLKLAFVALYPMEKGWITGRSLAEESKPSLRDYVQAIYMKIPKERVDFIKSGDYDYFRELKEEKVYLDKASGKFNKTELVIPKVKDIFVSRKKMLKKFPRQLIGEGTYILAKNGEHVKEIIEQGNLAFVLTIEGANVFNTTDNVEAIKERIREVKDWKESVFFISLTHHFYNYLAGHAHSIPDIGKLVLDQSLGINSGFTKKGLEVTRYLLGIDKAGNFKPGELGRRILIDVKHLNVVSRKEYYEKFVQPSFATMNPIPVIASHVAYSGRATMQELIENMAREKDHRYTKRNGHKFNNWNINLCDEDVVMIYKSQGLIGINLDQRVLGVLRKDARKKSTHANYVWQNIKAMMKVITDSADPEIKSKKEVTDLFCLGTDFDGFIDPLNKYPTVLQFEDLRKDLIEVINNDPDRVSLTGNLNAENFVDKICFGNAFEFVVKNFKTDQ